MKNLALLICVLLAACNEEVYVTGDDINQGNTLCEINGGVSKIRAQYSCGRSGCVQYGVQIVCINGAMFQRYSR